MGNHNLLPVRSAAGLADRNQDGPQAATGVGRSSDDDAVDEGYDPPDTYDDYGDWKEDYADAVGISRWREL